MNLINDIDEFKIKYTDDSFLYHNELSADILEYYIENYNVDWYSISKYQTISESFIDKYKDKLNWNCISVYQTLSEVFITKYMDEVEWYCISRYQTLTEAFIIKYNDKVDWSGISEYQILSEQFIIKYSDKVDWYYISGFQTLSESFITKYNDRLNWYSLFDNKKITLRYDFIVQHLYDFNLYSVCIGIKNNDNVNINRLIEEYTEKYNIDKLAHEFNK